MDNNEGDQNQKEVADQVYAHIKELAQFKYESELRREDSLIRQSSNMQTVFAFTTAALFMSAPVIITYRGSLSLTFFLVVFSSITLALMISLIFATRAQKRFLVKTFPDIEEIEKTIEKDYKFVLTKAQRNKQFVELLGEVQKGYADRNDKRVKWVRWSMNLFYAAIILSMFWFIVAIWKII